MRGTIAEPIHDPAAPMTRPAGPWPECAASAFTTARERAQDAVMLGRMTRDLPGFLRRPLSLGEAGAASVDGSTSASAAFSTCWSGRCSAAQPVRPASGGRRLRARATCGRWCRARDWRAPWRSLPTGGLRRLRRAQGGGARRSEAASGSASRLGVRQPAGHAALRQPDWRYTGPPESGAPLAGGVRRAGGVPRVTLTRTASSGHATCSGSTVRSTG